MSAQVSLLQVKQAIGDFLQLPQEQLKFQFSAKGGGQRFDLLTINAQHGVAFLLHAVQGDDELDAAQRMFSYLQTEYLEEYTFTVQWLSEQHTTLQTSYFKGAHIYDALDKFYFGKDLNEYQIFNVSVQP